MLPAWTAGGPRAAPDSTIRVTTINRANHDPGMAAPTTGRGIEGRGAWTAGEVFGTHRFGLSYSRSGPPPSPVEPWVVAWDESCNRDVFVGGLSSPAIGQMRPEESPSRVADFRVPDHNMFVCPWPAGVGSGHFCSRRQRESQGQAARSLRVRGGSVPLRSLPATLGGVGQPPSAARTSRLGASEPRKEGRSPDDLIFARVQTPLRLRCPHEATVALCASVRRP